MAFQKGQGRPLGSGRKQGSQNKKRIAKVADLLAEQDISPVQEILDLINDPGNGMFSYDRVKAWFDLLSYCEAKPKASDSDSSDEDDLDDFDEVSNEDLLKLIKTPNGVA